MRGAPRTHEWMVELTTTHAQATYPVDAAMLAFPNGDVFEAHMHTHTHDHDFCATNDLHGDFHSDACVTIELARRDASTNNLYSRVAVDGAGARNESKPVSPPVGYSSIPQEWVQLVRGLCGVVWCGRCCCGALTHCVAFGDSLHVEQAQTTAGSGGWTAVGITQAATASDTASLTTDTAVKVPSSDGTTFALTTPPVRAALTHTGVL